MNRRTADAIVVSVLVGLLVLGAYGVWTSYRHAQAMGGMMGGMVGMGPFLYVLGTLVGVAIIGGGYLMVRERDTGPSESRDPIGETAAIDERNQPAAGSDEPDRSTESLGRNRTRLFDALPEDERRILEPLVDSPGITQTELRDRSDFSKAKVSQTVTNLEKRGLLYRERQGRTYRVYPDDSLTE